MRKANKSIISLAVVLIAGLNIIVPAFAQDPFTSIAIGGIGGASGAGLFGSMAGMSGVNITWSQSGSDPMDAMWNVLNPDHVYFTGEKHEADPQQYPEDIYDYIEVDIGDWLDAQSDFIVNFIQSNQVGDNDSGTISNPPSFNGYPFPSAYGDLRYGPVLGNISIVGSFIVGPCEFRITAATSTRIDYQVYYNGVLQKTNWTTSSNIVGKPLVLARSNNTGDLSWCSIRSPNTLQTIVSAYANSSTGSTIIPWTSGTVNSTVFDGWENARVKIPHSISGLTSGWTVPDFTNAINNLWDQGLQGQIVIEDTDQPIPPPPIPDTPLGDVPFDDWIDLWGQGIYQQLENQNDALDFIGSNGVDAVEELESIDSNLEDLEETVESIDTNIGIGNGLLGGIKSATESAVEFLEGIAEHVEELVEEIVEGTETLIAGILNQIPAVFGVIFGPIKQASSIWHYVVEWIQSISAPMTWVWSMASGTSYYIVLPVYASLAGAVVLAFYKRFGK